MEWSKEMFFANAEPPAGISRSVHAWALDGEMQSKKGMDHNGFYRSGDTLLFLPIAKLLSCLCFFSCLFLARGFWSCPAPEHSLLSQLPSQLRFPGDNLSDRVRYHIGLSDQTIRMQTFRYCGLSTKNPVFSSLILRSSPAKQEGAVSSVILGTWVAVCIPFGPTCAIYIGLRLGNVLTLWKKSLEEMLNPIQLFTKAKSEMRRFISFYH